MQEFITAHYDWFKALHVISVISWMAGLLYLPRLFVYHADADKGSELYETLTIMERRLLRFIMNPAMIATWLFGACLLWSNWNVFSHQGWLHVKLTMVVLLTGFHHALAKWRKKFFKNENTKTAKFFRRINEIPTLLMIIIVIMVIVKPF
jgi:protoporphyrinogen IX oxidase